MTQRCIIVGAGHAAAQLTISLRSEGWQDDILVIGEEDSLPYQRPPLSKAYLNGEIESEKMLIRPATLYEKKQINFQLKTKVTRVNRVEKTIDTEDGQTISYDKLCLATGTRARRLDSISGANLKGIFYLRTLQDVDAIIDGLKSVNHAVIVGGGYIGLETAASLRKKGIEVTIVEAADRILQRVTCPLMSEFFARVHKEEGVSILEGAGLSEFVGSASEDGSSGSGEVSGIKTSDGNFIPADIVIVGVGIIVNDDLAKNSGLALDNGIVVDDYCVTSDQDILALGDCSNHYSAHYERRIRLESVPNAVDQAKIVAKAIVGKKEKYNSLPWFWSDQYDIKLQIAGLSQDYDEVVVRGNTSSRSFCIYYLLSGVLIAADAVNSPAQFMDAKKRILARGVAPEAEGA